MQASAERDAGTASPEGSSRIGRWREAGRAIVSTYRTATSIPLIVLSLAGVVLAPLGWWLAAAIFLPTVSQGLPAHVDADRRLFAQWPGFREPGERWHLGMWLARRQEAEPRPVVVTLPPSDSAGSTDGPDALVARPVLPFWYRAPDDPVVTVPYQLASPVVRLFDRDLGWGPFLFYLLGAAWNLVVWALLGAAICRLAALRIGRDQRAGLREAALFGQRRWLGLIGAPSLPLLAIALLGLPLIVLGLVARLDFGLLLAAILFPLVLLAGLLMTILALGLLFGWPLMWGTIGAEGSDSFDAISRSYAYTLQVPARYLIYAAVAIVVAVLGWLVTWLVATAVVAFSQWGLAWGMGATRAAQVDAWMAVPAQAPSLAAWAVMLLRFFVGLVWLAASAVAYSHFWCLATAVYLLLRRDADEAELDDIFQEEEGDATYGLPEEEGTEALGEEANTPGSPVMVPAEAAPPAAETVRPVEQREADGDRRDTETG